MWKCAVFLQSIHLQRIASLLENIPTWKLRRQLNQRNVVLLVTKKIWKSINPVRKNMSQVYKIMFKQIVPVFLQCFLKALNNTSTICLKEHMGHGLWEKWTMGQSPLGVSWLWALHTSSHCVQVIFSVAYLSKIIGNTLASQLTFIPTKWYCLPLHPINCFGLW